MDFEFSDAAVKCDEKAIASDLWHNRARNMKCETCMYYVAKGVCDNEIHQALGRCRKNAPTMSGFPVVFSMDWCGQHKIDENKV